jgi:hypothetical protein
LIQQNCCSFSAASNSRISPTWAHKTSWLSRTSNISCRQCAFEAQQCTPVLHIIHPDSAELPLLQCCQCLYLLWRKSTSACINSLCWRARTIPYIQFINDIKLCFFVIFKQIC